jgi:hypothetical protein
MEEGVERHCDLSENYTAKFWSADGLTELGINGFRPYNERVGLLSPTRGPPAGGESGFDGGMESRDACRAPLTR